MSAASLETRQAAATPSALLMQLLLSRLVGVKKGRDYCLRICALIREIHGIDAPTPSRSRRPQHYVDELWEIASEIEESYVLPAEVIARWIPPAFQNAIAEQFAAGPHAFKTATEKVGKRLAMGRDRDYQPRNPLSSGALTLWLTGARRLMRQADELRRLAFDDNSPIELSDSDLEVLRRWHSADAPQLANAKDLGAKPAGRDRSAAPLRVHRQCFRDMTRFLNHRRALPGKKRLEGGVFIVARDRVMLGLGCFGFRAETITHIRRGDYLPAFEFAPGVVGPALLVRKLKGLPGVERIAAIPVGFARWIDEYLEIVAEIEQRYGYTVSDEQGLLLPEKWSKWPGWDKFTEGGLSDRIAELLKPYTNGRRYSVHTCRHLAEQLATFAGNDWMLANRESLVQDGRGLPASGQTLADVQCDHAIQSVVDRYKDMGSEAARQWWRRITVQGMWEYLWGDKGAPKGLDIERVRQAKARLQDAVSDDTRRKTRIDDLRNRRSQLKQRRIARRQEIIENWNAIAADERQLAQFEIDSLTDQADLISDQIEQEALSLGRCARELERAQREYEEATTALVPIADEDEPVLAVGESDVVSGDEDGDVLEQPILRRTFDRAEFHWALGGNEAISDRQLRRLLKGESSWRTLFDDDGNGKPNGVRQLSAHKVEVSFDVLPLDRYPAPVIERLEALMRREPRAFNAAVDLARAV